MHTTVFSRLIGVFCALLLLVPLSARADSRPLGVEVSGRALSSDSESFILNGSAYIPLGSFINSMGGGQLEWDGTAARLDTEALTLTAQPGQFWVEANGRTFYVPDSVLLVNGRTMVPVRVAAKLFGAQVEWDDAQYTVRVSGGGQPPEHGDTYYDPDTLYWLSRVISAESRGEPLTGQIAVGNVALNRVESPDFPNTLYGVIFQPGQFEPVENGTIYLDPYHLSVTAAKLCLEGAQAVENCLYFFAPDLSPGTWIVNNRTYYTTIGCHRFYL